MKRIITIFVTLLLLIHPIKVQAQEIDGVFMPSVGIVEIVDGVTEDQARWAYSYEVGRQLELEDDIRLMSSLIWCEAGNQCEAGKQAVGIVVMNRVDDASFANTVEDVIYEPGQFRPKDNNMLNEALRMYDNGELPQECIDAANYALSGETIVNYNNQDIDMSPYLYFARNWSNEKIRIQDHDFK